MLYPPKPSVLAPAAKCQTSSTPHEAASTGAFPSQVEAASHRWIVARLPVRYLKASMYNE